MTRREIRELIFKMVFRVEFHNEEEIPEQLRLFMDTLESADEKDRAYIEHKVQDLLDHLEEIDAIIDSSAQNWKTSRMAKVELTLIRLAVYEIRFDEEIPTISVMSMLVVNDKVDDKLGYEIAKAIFSNLDRLQAAHSVGKLISKENAEKGMSLDMNAGAKKFFEESK